MVVRMDPFTLETARKLLCTLAKNFPIFYAMGNHETKMKAKGHLYRNEYLKYQAELKQKGICFLANEKSKVVLAGNSFCGKWTGTSTGILSQAFFPEA